MRGVTSVSLLLPSPPISCVSLVSSLRGLLCVPSQVVSPVHGRAGACGRIPGGLRPPLLFAVPASVIHAPCVLRVCVPRPPLPGPRGWCDPALLLCTAHRGLAGGRPGPGFPTGMLTAPSACVLLGTEVVGAPTWPTAGSGARVME